MDNKKHCLSANGTSLPLGKLNEQSEKINWQTLDIYKMCLLWLKKKAVWYLYTEEVYNKWSHD